MEIVKWAFYILLGFLAFGIAIYFIFSPFALVIGLFNPRAVLDDKKPQTRIRVLKSYGITSTILALMAFGIFSSVPAEESSYATTYSTSSVATTSTYTPTVQQVASSQTPVEEAWVNVRSDRAVQVVGIIEANDSIVPDNEFFEPVEAQGGQLIMVGIKIKNTGQESGNMAWSTYQLVDAQERKYDEINDFSESMSIKEWLKDRGLEEPSSQLFPGQTVEVAKVFRVAPDASDFKLAVNGKLISIN